MQTSHLYGTKIETNEILGTSMKRKRGSRERKAHGCDRAQNESERDRARYEKRQARTPFKVT